MIIDVIQGGLGNQMFEYAYGYVMAKENKEPLLLDISHYRINREREPLLLLFKIPWEENISYQYFPKKLWSFWIEVLYHMVHAKLTKSIYREYKKGHSRKVQWIEEKSKEYSVYKREKKFSHGVLLGFWQNENYFIKYREELLQQFKPKHNYEKEVQELLEDIEKEESVSLHIRRGDYLRLNISMSMDYYKNAVKYIEGKVKEPKFYIFSDDMDWVKEHLPLSHNAAYVNLHTKTKDIDEMMLMSACKHNIIANSTYSWWGAWLGNREGKIVIAPKDGFITETMIPKDWVKLVSTLA